MSEATSVDERLKRLEGDVNQLHDALENKGINSRQVKDALHGRTFQLPVDSEHKAKVMPVWKCGNPHMRAFHASWMGFFTTFLSTFAAAPLATVLKQENTLNLSNDQVATANITSVAFTIVARLGMGVVCDVLGARKGLAFLLLLTVPGIIGIMCVTSAGAFIACRAIIGMSLASFVACQVWCTQQFSSNVVGTANATAGGWGNLGGGVAQLVIPVVYTAFLAATGNNEDLSWRLAFLVPLVMHILAAMFALSGRDLPDGNFKELELSGAKQKSQSGVVTKVGMTNINAWLLTISYGFCFGIELTMNNIAASFFGTYFGLDVVTAGVLASVFGMVNLFARSLGGITSDWAAGIWGMRGRIWQLWFWQTVQGVLCLLMATITMSSEAPFPTVAPTLTGWAKIGEAWLPFNSSDAGFANGEYLIQHCGTKQVILDHEMRSMLDPAFTYPAVIKSVVLTEAPAPYAGGSDCISNANSLGLVVFLLFAFSISVQMAEGLTFGIVPSVSRPALGVVNGMVGAGGNLGSVITLSIFFKGSFRTDVGIYYMGITIIIITALTVVPIYFPDKGWMFGKAGSLGKYDPQIIKPPKGYRGADSMDYQAAQIQAPGVTAPTPTTTSQVEVGVISSST